VAANRGTAIKVLTIAFLLASQNLAYAGSDRLTLSSDMPRPYCFSHICSFKSGGMWSVGGMGSILYTSPTGKQYRRTITAADLLGIYFVNTTTGWIVGTNGTILVSTNSGKDWFSQFSNTEEDLKSISCVDENHCWIVGTSGIILRTEDGGRNWRQSNAPGGVSLNAVSFVTPEIGWAVGSEGIIIHTRNGGETWNVSKAILTLFPNTDFATESSWYGVKFINEKIGWVAGSRGVAKTVDGGKTWRTFDLDDSFIGIVTQDGNEVWAVSRYGCNYHTQNSGKTWNKCEEAKRE
jgi:photosystem II stability/assembly factor-like uncharacterized protein